MISKEEFKTLVDKVVAATGKTQETIALEMKYGKNYISEIMSPTGRMTSKFVNSFRLRYENILENPKSETIVPVRHNDSTENPPVLESLITQLITLSKTANTILERQEKELIQKVDRIDTNLNGLSAQAEKIMLDLESGRTVVLQSLARIEKKNPDELLDAADNLKNGLAASTGEPYKKNAKSNSRTGRKK